MLLLLNPTAEFKGGTGKHKVEGKEEAKAARNNMLKRYMDLLLPQKKLFAYAILSSVILTLIGIVSTVFNKAIMDEVLPYGLKKSAHIAHCRVQCGQPDQHAALDCETVDPDFSFH